MGQLECGLGQFNNVYILASADRKLISRQRNSTSVRYYEKHLEFLGHGWGSLSRVLHVYRE
jgi:hypothetical protein